MSRCFKNKRATFMILGDICTRSCSFCAVGKTGATRLFLDEDEPTRIAQVVKIMNLRYVVITSVTRDDLTDGGAVQFVRTVEAIRRVNQYIKIELLIPDFAGKICSLKCVLDTKPDVIAHNMETVPRLYPHLRPQADYQLSLDILSRIKELSPAMITKSSLMLGLGEDMREVVKVMQDLRAAGCDILTLGQYLVPSLSHYPVKEFIPIEQFQQYAVIAKVLKFKKVFSAPLARSSYDAENLHQELSYV